MANPHKGEAPLVAGEKTYTLRFSINAICLLEEKHDRSFGEIAKDLASWAQRPERMRITLVRDILWAGLQDCHPEVDAKAAGDIITEAGGAAAAFDAINEAFGRAFPDAKTKGARPPK